MGTYSSCMWQVYRIPGFDFPGNKAAPLAYFCAAGNKLLIIKKTIITVLALAGLTVCLNSMERQRVNNKDGPATIQTSFKTEFPDARDVEWKLKDGYYKVDFEVNDIDQIASFDVSCKLASRGIALKELNFLPH